jgi:hypothetical protein
MELRSRNNESNELIFESNLEKWIESEIRKYLQHKDLIFIKYWQKTKRIKRFQLREIDAKKRRKWKK